MRLDVFAHSKAFSVARDHRCATPWAPSRKVLDCPLRTGIGESGGSPVFKPLGRREDWRAEWVPMTLRNHYKACSALGKPRHLFCLRALVGERPGCRPIFFQGPPPKDISRVPSPSRIWRPAIFTDTVLNRSSKGSLSRDSKDMRNRLTCTGTCGSI
jgi:hypothetical protein